MPGFELIGKEEKEAVDEVFDKGGVLYRYGLDDRRQHIFRVIELEKEIAKKVGVKYCHCVSHGTAALKIGLFALGVKPGDEVITQSFTFIATVEAILELGAKPVITEVDKSLNMDPEDLEKKITERTKVIIPVPMAGVAPKMAEIMAIARYIIFRFLKIVVRPWAQLIRVSILALSERPALIVWILEKLSPLARADFLSPIMKNFTKKPGNIQTTAMNRILACLGEKTPGVFGDLIIR